MRKGVVFGPVHRSSLVVGRRFVLTLFEDSSDLSFGSSSLFQPRYQEDDRNRQRPSN